MNCHDCKVPVTGASRCEWCRAQHNARVRRYQGGLGVPPDSQRSIRCSSCGETGHNRRICSRLSPKVEPEVWLFV
jgi:hypothetical protein